MYVLDPSDGSKLIGDMPSQRRPQVSHRDDSSARRWSAWCQELWPYLRASRTRASVAGRIPPQRCALGLEYWVAPLADRANIRETTSFSRDLNRLNPQSPTHSLGLLTARPNLYA
jgi:hypothetical protein